MTRPLIAACALLAFVVAGCEPLSSAGAHPIAVAPGVAERTHGEGLSTIVVGLQSGADPAAVAAAAGATLVHSIPQLHAAVMTVPTSAAQTDPLAPLASTSGVAYVERALRVPSHGRSKGVAGRTAADPLHSSQWHLAKIHAPDAWDVGLAKALEDGAGWDYDIARGIVWSVDQGADVVNLSLGSPSSTAVLRDAVVYAIDRGVVVVASTGNDGIRQVQYPAAFPGVIAVAATTADDDWAAFSTFGDMVDLSAPGVAVLAAVPGGYAPASGTSMAAPIVNGVAALVVASRPGLAPAAIQSILERTAVDLGDPGRDILFGAGRVDAGAALWSLAPPTASPTVTATATPTASPSPTSSPTPPPVHTATPAATVRPVPSREAPTGSPPAGTDEAPAPMPTGRRAAPVPDVPSATRPPDAGYEPPTEAP